MSTTLIFAELLIIGVQTCVWLLLLGISILGYDWLQPFQSTTLINWQVPIVLVMLSVIYVVGLIFDRLADALFLNWDIRIRNKLLPNYSVPIGVMRFEVSKDNEYLNHQFEYTRSRMRVARASAINFGLITIFSVVLLFARFSGANDLERIRYIVFVVVTGLSLTLAAVFSWYKLMIAYFTFVKANYEFHTSKKTSTLAPLGEKEK